VQAHLCRYVRRGAEDNSGIRWQAFGQEQTSLKKHAVHAYEYVRRTSPLVRLPRCFILHVDIISVSLGIVLVFGGRAVGWGRCLWVLRGVFQQSRLSWCGPVAVAS
jgi:hypothetical protein